MDQNEELMKQDFSEKQQADNDFFFHYWIRYFLLPNW